MNRLVLGVLTGLAVAAAALGLAVVAFDVELSRQTDDADAVTVPAAVGVPEGRAREIIRDAGLEPRVSGGDPFRSDPFGTPSLIQGQDPPAGAEVDAGSRVDLFLGEEDSGL